MLTYKGSYFEIFVKELTSLDIDFSTFDEYGYPQFAYDEKGLLYEDAQTGEARMQKIWRASKYSQREGTYSEYMDRLGQDVLSELSLIDPIQAQSILKRLELLQNNITKAWKVYFDEFHKFQSQDFDSWDFELKFFHLFGLKASRFNMDSYSKGSITQTFWWELQDALMYKEGALKLLVYHLKEMYFPEQIEPKEEMPETPTVTKVLPKLNIALDGYREMEGIAMLYGYLDINLTLDEATYIGELCNRVGGQGLLNDIKRYCIPRERTGFDGEKPRGYKLKLNRFDWIIEKLTQIGKSELVAVASEEKGRYIACYQENKV